MRARWWQVLYGICFGTPARVLLTAALKIYARVRSRAAAEGVVGAIDRRCTFSGWPHQGRGWTNLHASRFTTHVRRRMEPNIVSPPRRGRRALKRLACVGRFSGLLSFPKELMERCPVELVIADIRFRDTDASYLADVCDHYRVFDLDASPADADRLAAFVNQADVDMVLNIGQKTEVHGLLDRFDAACLSNYCAGSDLLHHDGVDIQYHGQPEADYFVRGDTMFCATTRRRFSDQFVHTITGYIDPRGLLQHHVKPWRERQPLIVCHGSLFKFAGLPFLAIVADWLQAEPAAQLVLVGRDLTDALSVIRGELAARGLSSRFRYDGHFSAVRDTSGVVSGEGWDAVVTLLGNARLAPNPFPLGGGSSRYEAYALGAPAPHLAVRFDEAAWGRPQPSICEIPSMLVPRGTADSLDGYRQLGLRCLRDEAFADALAADQRRVAHAITDADRWWREIIAGHERWMERDSERAAS